MRSASSARWRSGILSGRTLSDWHAHTPPRAAGEWPLISLEPASRAWLHQRIATRFDAMLEAGFVDEVRQLRQRPGLHPDLPSMRCVGYRQAWAALDGGDLGALRDAGIAATRQLAKRQLTWLRSMHDRHVIACDDVSLPTQAAALLRGLMRAP